MSRIFKKSKTRFWQIDYVDLSGNRVRKSLKTTNKSVALRKKQLLDQQIRNHIITPTANLPILVKDYLHQIKGVVSPRYHRDLRHRLSCFLNSVPITHPADIDTVIITRHIVRLNDQQRQPQTIRNHFFAVSGFCKYLITNGFLVDNPCQGIKLPKIHRTAPRYLTDQEYYRTLLAAGRHGILLPVAMALKTGLRSTEIRFLQWQDIHWRPDGHNMITVVRSKNYQGRTIPLHPALTRRLAKIKQDSGPIFRGVRGGFVGEKQWRELLKPIQRAIPKFTRNHSGTGTAWHLLRHTFGYRLATAGVPIPVIKELMGHADIQTTMIYARLAPDVWREEIVYA